MYMEIRVTGFEPTTSCSQNRYATGLRYTLIKKRADNGNRTHMICLEGREFTINLYPHYTIHKDGRITGIEPIFPESQSDTLTV